MVDANRPIRRSRSERMLGGVLGGLADWLGCHPSVARVGYILLTAFTGFALGIVAYVILWVFIPEDEAAGTVVATPPPPAVPRAS